MVVRIYEDQVAIPDPVRMEVIRRHPRSRRAVSLMIEPGDRIFNPSRETDRQQLREVWQRASWLKVIEVFQLSVDLL